MDFELSNTPLSIKVGDQTAKIDIGQPAFIVGMGVPGPPGPLNLFCVDEFVHGEVITPKRVAMGSILRFLNGVLLRSSDDLITEPGDCVTLIYQEAL